MKPILFKTDMVRAILDGRKTVTRRVVKPQPKEAITVDYHDEKRKRWIRGICTENGNNFPAFSQLGDILYVRETFARIDEDVDSIWFEEPGQLHRGQIIYKADYGDFPECNWRPSIHMPREAARLFLRVTDVRVERLQEITADGIRSEGVQSKKPEWLRIDFADLWNSTINPKDLALYGWDANPWVWVIAFERISIEEAEHG